ncbi:probable methyltransferase PMT26 [Oryza brachyantha]|uniref:probable methyltransferase PMT26 n=1 Tax=Oryza brachyantha TaxID=4533 RepID=UPI001ADBA12A|nr:probable methyltransferase PMT26 [Oryza brachyantha]
MALFDRNQRQRSSLCSTATVVVFVSLCLVGLWMISSPETIPAANKKADALVKEEDSSIDATNNVKQNSANVVAETTAAAEAATDEADSSLKPAGDTKGDGEKATTSKDQTFDDENGRTEGGALVKPENGGDEAATDVKEIGGLEQATIDMNDTGEQTMTDTKEGVVQDKSPEEMAAAGDAKESGDGGDGGATKNKQTFDDENGKLDGVNLVKDVENKTLSEENSKPLPEETTTVSSKNAIVAAVVPLETTTTAISDEKLPDNGEQGQDEQRQQQQQPVEALPNGQADLLTERAAQNGSFTTQAAESIKEKKTRAEKTKKKKGKDKKRSSAAAAVEEDGDTSFGWKLCNTSAGADYIPCLDNEAAIKKLKTDAHYEHRERHCPGEPPTCLVPAPEGYREPIRWPRSRDKIWYHNVPHTKLAAYKGHQNWVKLSGEHLTFPGGGTQFKHGALHYIELIQSSFPEVAWGRRSRLVLDVGCGVASFGGYLFDHDVLTMSLAPKDEHEAQVQFALERGIPAISAVMGTRRLPFPSNVFDVVHCARCRVPWHIEGGMLLLELNRLVRPGGFFVWSATPVYQKLPEDVEIWGEMVKLTKAMCWEMVSKTRDTVDQVGLVIFRKPSDNACYKKRRQKEPPLCEPSDDPNAAWNITLRACMHWVPTDPSVRGSRWPERWPERVETTPYWLNSSQVGVYGKPAPDDFVADHEHWKKVVRNSYLTGMGIDWKTVRNVMDMRAVYGGFAAALRDMSVWVMNVVTINSPDTLPVIYERGLFGIYHDWCESFSTYPRSYDLLHADHLFSKLKSRCKVLPVIVEVDRILRPNGKLIVRDDKETVDEVQGVVRSLQWEVRMTVSKNREAMLCARKTTWRPTDVEAR